MLGKRKRVLDPDVVEFFKRLDDHIVFKNVVFIPDWVNKADQRLRARERSRGVKRPSSITSEIVHMFKAQGKCCANCGVKFVVDKGFRHDDAPIVDRIDTATNPRYRDNFQLLCSVCNTGKSGFDLLDQVKAQKSTNMLPCHNKCSKCGITRPREHFKVFVVHLHSICIFCEPPLPRGLTFVAKCGYALRQYVTKTPHLPPIDVETAWNRQHGRCATCQRHLTLIHRHLRFVSVLFGDWERLVCGKCRPHSDPWRMIDLINEK